MKIHAIETAFFFTTPKAGHTLKLKELRTRINETGHFVKVKVFCKDNGRDQAVLRADACGESSIDFAKALIEEL